MSAGVSGGRGVAMREVRSGADADANYDFTVRFRLRTKSRLDVSYYQPASGQFSAPNEQGVLAALQPISTESSVAIQTEKFLRQQVIVALPHDAFDGRAGEPGDDFRAVLFDQAKHAPSEIVIGCQLRTCRALKCNQATHGSRSGRVSFPVPEYYIDMTSVKPGRTPYVFGVVRGWQNACGNSLRAVVGLLYLGRPSATSRCREPDLDQRSADATRTRSAAENSFGSRCSETAPLVVEAP
jgi:hypothetical protein